MSHFDEEEYLDLVDDGDRVIGTMSREEVHAKGLRNFRVINVFLVNGEGKLWIPRRAPHKRIYPGALDMSVGGHVSSGESYEEAFRRETLEEVNIDVSVTPYRFLGKVTPQDGVHAFEHVYEIRTDKAPDYNRDDFTEYFWLTPGEFFERIAKGDTAKSDLPRLVELFYGRN